MSLACFAPDSLVFVSKHVCLVRVAFAVAIGTGVGDDNPVDNNDYNEQVIAITNPGKYYKKFTTL